MPCCRIRVRGKLVSDCQRRRTLVISTRTVSAGPACMTILSGAKSAILFDPLLAPRSEEHTSELQSRPHLVCRLLLEKKNNVHIVRSVFWDFSSEFRACVIRFPGRTWLRYLRLSATTRVFQE